jgi:endoglucanase
VVLNTPNKVVYSPHDYGPGVYAQNWFSDPTFPANMNSIWYNFWAKVHINNIAPIWVGEFGGRNTLNSSTEGIWQNTLVDYIKNNSLNWAYWCVNPNSGDTGGILKDDWTTLEAEKVAMLSRILS